MRTPVQVREDCKALDAELDLTMPQRENWTLSARAIAHLRACERCQSLYEFLMRNDRPAASLAADSMLNLQEEVQQRLKQSLKPVTPQAAPRTLAAQFLLVFFLFAAPMIGMLGTAGFHEMNPVQMTGIGTVLICGAALLSMSLAWQMSPGSLQLVRPRVAILTLTAGFLFGTAILFPWQAPQEFWLRGWTCLKGGLLMAAPAGVLFWLLLRRGHTFSSGVLGATLGAICGLLGATVLQLTCSHQDAAHLMIWHGGVVVVAIALGALSIRMMTWLIRSLNRGG